MPFVYILESKKNGRYYIGSTKDIGARLIRHKAGKVGATKVLLPVDLVFKKEVDNFSEARILELKLKKLKRKDYLKKIILSGELTI